MPSVQRFQKHQKVRQLTYQFSKPISYFANSVMSHLWTIAQHFRIRGGRKYERHRKYLKKKFYFYLKAMTLKFYLAHSQLLIYICSRNTVFIKLVASVNYLFKSWQQSCEFNSNSECKLFT